MVYFFLTLFFTLKKLFATTNKFLNFSLGKSEDMNVCLIKTQAFFNFWSLGLSGEFLSTGAAIIIV